MLGHALGANQTSPGSLAAGAGGGGHAKCEQVARAPGGRITRVNVPHSWREAARITPPSLAGASLLAFCRLAGRCVACFGGCAEARCARSGCWAAPLGRVCPPSAPVHLAHAAIGYRTCRRSSISVGENAGNTSEFCFTTAAAASAAAVPKVPPVPPPWLAATMSRRLCRRAERSSRRVARQARS